MRKFTPLFLTLALFLSACSTPAAEPPEASKIQVDVEKPASPEEILTPGGGEATLATPEANLGLEIDEKAVVFELTGEDFKFMMEGKAAPELRVKEGDTVVINFTSDQGFHDWVLDEFNAATSQVKAKGSTSVTFVAEKKGIFEYYCSVGQHRANGMAGKLIVE